MLASLSALAAGVATAQPASAAVIAHTPVAAAAFGEAVAIDATLDCSVPDCSATLYFKTSDPYGEILPLLAAYTAQPMTVAPVTDSNGHYIVTATGTIPPTATDTRGVDYLLSVTDGATTAWVPADPDAATPDLPVPFHIHVREPIHLVHAPATVVSYLHEPVHVTATATCATGTCDAELSYRTSTGLNTLEGTTTNVNDGLNGDGFTTVAMARRVVQDLGADGQVLEFTAEVPASAVDTNGVDYFVHVDDAYTNAYSPGTAYVGSPAPVDGTRAGWHHVEVFSRPQVVHVPPAYFVPGTALQVSAEVTSAAGFPTVTLLYREGSDEGFTRAAMTVRETPVRRPEGTVYTVTGAIPGSTTSRGGLMVYALAVDDGFQTAYSPASAGYVDSNLGYVVAVSNPVPL